VRDVFEDVAGGLVCVCVSIAVIRKRDPRYAKYKGHQCVLTAMRVYWRICESEWQTRPIKLNAQIHPV
jgi:hypothetical protein